MRSDLVCNIIWSALKDYDEMTHIEVLKLENRVVCRGAAVNAALKINHSIHVNARARLYSNNQSLQS